MKKIIFLFSCFAVLFILSSSVYANVKQPVAVKVERGAAKVSFLEGSAHALYPGQKAHIKLKINDQLKTGCEVITSEKTRLELILPDNSIVRFADSTRFTLLRVDAGEADKQRDVKIFVTMGKIWSNVRKTLAGKGGFDILCYNAVAGVRGTVYRVNVEADKSALVKVYDGEVAVGASPKETEQKAPVVGPPKTVTGPSRVAGPKPVSMEEWVYIIKAMQQIRIKSDGKPEEPKAFTEEEDRDDWVDWNKERDKK